MFNALRRGAKEFGFEIYLANLEYQVHGLASGQAEYCSIRYRGHDNEATPDDFEMDTTRTWVNLKLISAFDTNGMPVKMQELQFDNFHEVIKGSLDALDRVGHDSIVRKDIRGHPQNVRSMISVSRRPLT